MEKQIIKLDEEKIFTTSSLTSFVMKDQFPLVFKEQNIDLSILKPEVKAKILFKLADLESNNLPMIFDEDYFNVFPQNRGAYNNLVNGVVNYTFHKIKILSKEGKLTYDIHNKMLINMLTEIKKHNEESIAQESKYLGRQL